MTEEIGGIYLLELFNNQIVTKRYRGREFETLKIEGELSWGFDDGYWEWFLRKIDYENEPICLIVATDRESFEIDSGIIIADSCNKQIDFNYRGANIFYFPTIDAGVTERRMAEKNTNQHSDLANFMINKMRGYNEQR